MVSNQHCDRGMHKGPTGEALILQERRGEGQSSQGGNQVCFGDQVVFKQNFEMQI